MCDLFWVSPGSQGDLSDVVRASLHRDHQPAAASYRPPRPEEEAHVSPPLLEGGRGGGGMVVVGHGDEQQLPRVVMGGGGGGTRRSSDHHALLHHRPSLPPHGLMVSERPPPQLGRGGGAVVEREGDAAAVAAPPEIVLGDHLHRMPMADHRAHHLPAIKRRKNQMRKVVCIPAPTAVSGRPSTSGGEVVPSDLWAWRKYGQKPIKGSPYPRGYYRCSSSKGCPARKQVERSRTDPTMLVVTYTSDHNHPWPTQRNALAGSTRPSSSSSAAAKSTATTTFTPDQAYGSGGASATQHQLKQEALDADLDLFADMDALNIFSSPDTSKISLEDDTKEQLLDPFSSSFLDYWVSFGEADT